MRLTLLEPRGELNAQLVADALSLVLPPEQMPVTIQAWTPNERLLAYDWAMREHMSAGDVPTRRRPRPSFTIRGA